METPGLTDGWVWGSVLQTLLWTNEMHVSPAQNSPEGSSSARCWPEVLVAGTKAALDMEERTLASATFAPFWRARIRPNSGFTFLSLEEDFWVLRVNSWALDWPRPLEKIGILNSLIKKHKWKFQSRNGWTITNWLMGSLWFMEPHALIIPRRIRSYPGLLVTLSWNYACGFSESGGTSEI